MKVGSLGDIVFEVSADTVMTLKNLERSGSVDIQSHSRHLMKALPEFTGTSLEAVKFTVKLSEFLGVKPEEILNKIYTHMNAGTALNLCVGKTMMGKWLIKQYKTVYEHYDHYGTMIDCTVTLSLIEYVKE